MNALTIKNVAFSYDNTVPMLRDVSFDVHVGEFLSVVGPNGSGKTTLLRLLTRIYVPQHGTISLTERNLNDYSRSDIAKRITFVPQDSGILLPFTVLEVVLMGRAPHNTRMALLPVGRAFENGHDREIALKMMKLTDIEHLAHQPVTTLSGGERQRVFIARALAQEPEIILLDEPNAHLDIAHQIEVFELIKKLNRESGLTVVSVSHDLNLAAAYSDRIAMLLCGSLESLGLPEEVLTESHINHVFRTKVMIDRSPAGGRIRVNLLTSS